LTYSPIAASEDGYAIAVKGSSLKEEINRVLKELTAEGEIENLKKWLTG
jgi:hypothetical protein